MAGPSAAAISALIEQAREHQARGDIDLARAVYDDILKQSPDEPQALCLRGLIYRDRGDIAAAEKDFRHAIKAAPRMPLTYQLLGDLLHNAKHLVMAADIYEDGLRCDPDNVPILGNLAHTRLGLGHFEACLALSRRTVALDPAQQEAWFRLGAALCQIGRFEEALPPLQRAISLKADCLRSRAAICVAWHRLGKTDERAAALAAASPYIEARFDYLTQFNEVLAWLKCPELAVPLLEVYLERHPDSAAAWSLLARLHIVSGDEATGNALLMRAGELAPTDPDLALTLGLQLFKQGDFRKGLELYRHRWDRPDQLPREERWEIPAPAWNGEAMSEGALMVWTEQGIGDLAMFAGFFSDLADLAPRVMIETIGRFRGLMQRSFPWADIYQRDQLPPDFVHRCGVRAQVPIGDLPLLLNADFDQLPARRGYLIPDAAATWRLRERYQAHFGRRILVGISWRSGNKSSATTRSAELPLWRDVLSDSRFGFVSLQYGKVGAEVDAFNRETGCDLMVDPEVDPILDLDLFAAQVAAMDLIISVDNSTIHFAGAMGKPVWALLPFVADWRWLTDRTDSIWYDGAYLFRQPSPDAWPDVMRDVRAALAIVDATAVNDALITFMHRCAAQLSHLGNSPDAEIFFRRLLRIDIDDVDALHGLGRIAVSTGHAAEAQPFLARASELAPTRPDVDYELARLRTTGGRAIDVAPEWSPRTPPPKRLLLYSEGNLALDIAASSSLRRLRDDVDVLAVVSHPSLVPLLARLDRRLVIFSGEDISAEEMVALNCTGQASLSALSATASSASGPWMTADPARVEEQRLANRAKFGDRLVVGLVGRQEAGWAGAPWPQWNAIDVAVSSILALQQDFGVVVLEDPSAIAWPEQVRVDPRIDFRRRAETFAAAVAAVDVVVAVESAAAWLAVSLDRPLFLLETRSSPGSGPVIPARQRFRQSRNGSWARALTELLGAVEAIRRQTKS